MIIDYNKLNTNSEKYNNNHPFPHIVLDNIIDETSLEEVQNEIKNIKKWDDEKQFHGAINKEF